MDERFLLCKQKVDLTKLLRLASSSQLLQFIETNEQKKNYLGFKIYCIKAAIYLLN